MGGRCWRMHAWENVAIQTSPLNLTLVSFIEAAEHSYPTHFFAISLQKTDKFECNHVTVHKVVQVSEEI